MSHDKQMFYQWKWSKQKFHQTQTTNQPNKKHQPERNKIIWGGHKLEIFGLKKTFNAEDENERGSNQQKQLDKLKNISISISIPITKASKKSYHPNFWFGTLIWSACIGLICLCDRWTLAHPVCELDQPLLSTTRSRISLQINTRALIHI